MTGIGAYFYLVWGIWLRHCLNGRQAEYELSWPSVFSVPDIVHVSANGASEASGSGSSKIEGYGENTSNDNANLTKGRITFNNM